MSQEPTAGDTSSTPESLTVETPTERDFYIVGVGASAGGLEALERMFDHVPSDCNMAFVVVQHLSPDFKSVMDELLSRHTGLTIHRVEEGMAVERNSIYLIPPKKEMIITQGCLHLTDKDPHQSLTLPIDHFFRSLAQDAADRCIAVVLSGTGSDGSRGIRDIHEAGGLVIAQSEESAKFDGMPKSAAETGVVDIIVDPELIGETLGRYAAHPLRSQWKPHDSVPVDESALDTIFRLIQKRHSIDFNHYKPSTIGRRIERRIQLNHNGSLEDYVRQLEADEDEVDRLYRDLLINVTRFFRDRDAFVALDTEILPQLLLAAPANEEFRVWVAACATGEEAYTLAILIHEHLEKMKRTLDVKIFATDIHRASLERAGAGIYQEIELADLPTARRDKYFNRVENGYQICSEIRRMIVFAPHNLTKDAPFTRMQFVTCRNMLIYLRPLAQTKVLSLFHFGLKTGGVLFLGSSESPGELSEEFEPLDERWRIYRKRRDVRLPAETRSPLRLHTVDRLIPGASLGSPRGRTTPDGEIIAVYDELLSQHMPPGILLNENNELVQMFGGAATYLRMQDGRMTVNIFDLVDGDLRLALTGALQRVAKSRKPVTCPRVRVWLPSEEEVQLRLVVTPLQSRRAGSKTLVTFEVLQELTPPAPVADSTIELSEVAHDQVRVLEEELRYSKESLQATIEELETSNEELQATNEELVASNEELQSTNEELHSVNEELYTVNAEYQRKIHELTELTNDMDHLLESTDVHTLFLDESLCIRKFTPKMAEVFNLIGQDLGRRIDGFTHNIVCDQLTEKLGRVLTEGHTHEEEVCGLHGEAFLLRILPYCPVDVPTGVVLTLIDVNALKAAHAELEHSNLKYQDLYDHSPDMYLSVDANSGDVIECNQTLLKQLGYHREDVIGSPVHQLYHEESRERAQTCLQQLRETGIVEEEYMTLARSDGRSLDVMLKATAIRDEAGKVIRSRSVWRDVTQLKRAQREVKALSEIVESSTDGILSKDLNGNITSWNAAGEKLYGYTSKEAVGRSVTMIIPDDRKSEYTAIMQRIHRGESANHLETVRRRKDGSLIDVSLTISPIIDARNRVIGASAIARDITERKLLERRLQSTIECAPIGMLMIDRDDNIAMVNAEAERLFQYVRSELLGKSIDVILPARFFAGKETLYARLVDNPDFLKCDEGTSWCFLRKDGSEFPADLGATTIEAGDPHDEFILCAFADITRQKEVIEELHEEARHREQFLAMLSHELRNPMGAVLNALDLLQMDASEQTVESTDDAVGVISRQTRHMARLLDDLLDVARISQNKFEFRREVIELTTLVDAVLEAVDYEVNAKNQILHTTITDESLPILADPARIIQAQINLLTNAAKYTPDMGDIWYDIDRMQNEAVITIRDSGHGIPPDLIENIFELFVQSDSTLARSAGGMGVGLSLTRSIIEAHDGVVVASSAGTGQGSVFEIRLPLTKESPKPPTNSQPPAPHFTAGNCRLLIVEDNDDARVMLAKMLRLRGFDVQEAADGGTALQLVKDNKPDIAVVDIGLPVMDGYELAQRIRKSPDFDRTTLIALTGYGREEDKQQALAAGFDAHLVKPLNPEALFAAIEAKQTPCEPA